MKNKRELLLLHLENHFLSNKLGSILMNSMEGCPCENPHQNKSRNLTLRILDIEGEVTPSSLSQYLELNKSSVTSLIDSLEKEGLVLRKPDPDDRRQCFISLAPGGRQHLEVFDEFMDLISERIESLLSESEYEELFSSLSKVVELERRIETRLLEEQKKGNK
ncbi:DNA-binding MarR family transcriptional regulator [Methanohalophilus levihalophilus]|uniref:MarR family winged helix-turn-helix transcriptional regulator n=1 Tax=Methanohalophilus levihalophilus TaxID=1431282 RepID=UPI001AE734DF|nr:MarR family transcriptional regulator [Methanohalophilus levihalophilus]MBP2030432.1 DNA-binding MarR family transcriptional regulator [Methanohalophilus levihalophilus]